MSLEKKLPEGWESKELSELLPETILDKVELFIKENPSFTGNKLFDEVLRPNEKEIKEFYADTSLLYLAYAIEHAVSEIAM